MATINWEKAVQPLLKKYKGKKHPLDYENLYQLIVMVVLSAQTSDKLINSIAGKLFETFPDMPSMSRATPDTLIPLISKVIGHRKKAEWIIKIAQEVKTNKKIPLTMEALIELPGIGRKSASVIMREAGVPLEGVMVDLHVVRVAPRLGIAKGDDPKLIEQDIMKKIPEKDWEIGMAISFLGRDTCHKTSPDHENCIMKDVCAFYKKVGSKPAKKKK